MSGFIPHLDELGFRDHGVPLVIDLPPLGERQGRPGQRRQPRRPGFTSLRGSSLQYHIEAGTFVVGRQGR